jgi:hypothetical protein
MSEKTPLDAVLFVRVTKDDKKNLQILAIKEEKKLSELLRDWINWQLMEVEP